jgi:hypothetical protein
MLTVTIRYYQLPPETISTLHSCGRTYSTRTMTTSLRSVTIRYYQASLRAHLLDAHDDDILAVALLAGREEVVVDAARAQDDATNLTERVRE